MELILQVEKKISEWLRPIPDLPKTARTWLAQNVWWLVLASAILSGISILILIRSIIVFETWSSTINAYGVYATAPYASSWIIGSVVSLLFTIIITAMTAYAVKPLRALRYRGWMLLFGVYLISAIEIVINSVLSFNIIGFIFGLIFGAIGLAVTGYFLFQIRSYFNVNVRSAQTTRIRK